MKKHSFSFQFLSLLFLSASLFLGGCAYKLGSLTIGGISTIAIAAVVDETGKPFIEESSVTQQLIEEFHKDGTVKVVPLELADASAFVTLKKIETYALAFSDKDVGNDFRMIVDSELIIRRNGTDEILYQGIIQGDAIYGTDFDQSELERINAKNAIRDLAIDIVRIVIEGGW